LTLVLVPLAIIFGITSSVLVQLQFNRLIGE
jgi:hypothetical protein